METNKPVRFGIIGIGNMGGAHMRCLASGKIRGAVLTCVCDNDPAKESRAVPGVPFFGDYRELLKSGLADAVLIAVPHWLHPQIAIDAFAAGCHVLTEKPAGVRQSDVLQMNAAAKMSGKCFGIMWNQRTNPLFQKARELVQSGAIGQRKRLVWIVTNWYRPQNYYDSGTWRATWSGEGGGVLMNQAPHNLDLMQWIFGMPDEVAAHCDEGKWHRIEVEDDVVINGFYKDGATAAFLTSTGEYPGTNRLEISGSRGRIVIEKGTLTSTLYDRDEREFCFTDPAEYPNELPDSPVLTQTEPEPAHAGILQNFTDHILFGAPLLAPGEEGIREITLANAAYLSSWTGERIRTDNFDAERFNALLAEKISNSRVKTAPLTSEVPDAARWRTKW